MKKLFTGTASFVLALSLFAGGGVYAKQDGGNAGTATSAKAVKAYANETATVTSDTYETKGHKGYTGLLKAIENVKDKPAGAVIAEKLLTKYESELPEELKAELKEIVETDAALSKLADYLDQKGSVTDAVYVEKEAVKANLKNINSYKKLGHLYNKIGKTGLKLFVNGDEPVFEVAPFIKDGSTLVPFRAISESLRATVTWNGEERSVTVTRDGISVKLIIGSTTAYINGKEVTLEVPGEIVEGNTVVPVRFISEALKATVKWEGETKTVVIYEE